MRKIVLCMGAAVLIGSYGCESEQVTVKPQLESMTESVYASVTVQPEDLYDVYATVSGILERVPIEEGDSIRAGALVAKISADNQRINLDNAELNRQLASENYQGTTTLLENIKAELSAAQLQLSVDSLNYFRQNNLWAQKIGSRSELDNKELRYQLSQNQVATINKRLVQTKRDLANNYRRSTNNVASAKTNIEDFTVFSKIDGRVYALFKQEGELVTPQQPIAQIGRADSFVLEMNIDEVDVARVALGQEVIITLDAYKGAAFSAKVSRIFPQKDEQTQTFRAEAVFAEAPKKLFPGLSGEANIILSKKRSVLTIPAEYLTENNTVMTNDGEVEVSVGIRGLDKVEIKSGLDTSAVLQKRQ